MVALEDLRAARLTNLDAGGAGWQDLARAFTRLENDAVAGLIGPVHRSAWTGPAAEAAYRHLDGVDDGLALLAEQAGAVADLMRRAAAELGGLQSQLLAAEADILAAGARLLPDGSVEPAPVSNSGSLSERDAAVAGRRHNEAAQVLSDRIATILAQATAADERYAAALLRYEHPPSGVMSRSEITNATQDAQLTAPLLGAAVTAIPSAGQSAWTIRQWWDSLGTARQQAYLTAFPAMLGALNGIPTLARDQANRAVLRADALNSDAPWRRSQTLLNRLEASEYGPPEHRLYLLGIDNNANAGHGRVIVAVGDPDTARNVAVYVPGLNTDLNGINGDIVRAEHLQAAGDQITRQPGSTAAVMWLGYDAPQIDFSTAAVGDPHGLAEGVGDVAATHRGAAGGPLLDRFVNGLHATHTGPEAHYTAVGHSYGSTVVGESASHGHVLNVQDIIVAGSPGMDVNTADELNVGREHVWAGAAPDDKIPGLLSGASHSTNPVTTEFGANQFHVDTHGHSQYWKSNSESLNNQGLIITGQGDSALLDHRSAPPVPTETDRAWNPAGGPLAWPR